MEEGHPLELKWRSAQRTDTAVVPSWHSNGDISLHQRLALRRDDSVTRALAPQVKTPAPKVRQGWLEKGGRSGALTRAAGCQLPWIA